MEEQDEADAAYEEDMAAPETPVHRSPLDHARRSPLDHGPASQEGQAIASHPAPDTSSQGDSPSQRERTQGMQPTGVARGSCMQPTALPGTGSSAADGSAVADAVATSMATGSSATSSETSPGSSATTRSVQPQEQKHVQSQPTASRVMTRLQKGIKNPKVRNDGTIPYGMLCVSGEP